MTKMMIMILMNLKTYLKKMTKTLMKTITMKMIVFLYNIRLEH